VSDAGQLGIDLILSQGNTCGHPLTSRPAHTDRPEAGGGTRPSAPEEVSHEGCPTHRRRAPGACTPSPNDCSTSGASVGGHLGRRDAELSCSHVADEEGCRVPECSSAHRHSVSSRVGPRRPGMGDGPAERGGSVGGGMFGWSVRGAVRVGAIARVCGVRRLLAWCDRLRGQSPAGRVGDVAEGV
jgi:hypothetical protein